VNTSQPSITTAFVTTLKTKRLKLKLSQEKFEELSNLSMRSISLLETQKQQPTLKTIYQIANAFEITTSQFLAEVELNFCKG
jgi:transcriptional regulator with XRE-family HTH domain